MDKSEIENLKIEGNVPLDFVKVELILKEEAKSKKFTDVLNIIAGFYSGTYSLLMEGQTTEFLCLTKNFRSVIAYNKRLFNIVSIVYKNRGVKTTIVFKATDSDQLLAEETMKKVIEHMKENNMLFKDTRFVDHSKYELQPADILFVDGLSVVSNIELTYSDLYNRALKVVKGKDAPVDTPYTRTDTQTTRGTTTTTTWEKTPCFFKRSTRPSKKLVEALKKTSTKDPLVWAESFPTAELKGKTQRTPVDGETETTDDFFLGGFCGLG